MRLPRRLVHRLREAGRGAIHALDLPERNRTTDRKICARAEADDRLLLANPTAIVRALAGADLFHLGRSSIIVHG